MDSPLAVGATRGSVWRVILEFDSVMYRWAARTDADWYFADVPEELSEQIAEMQHPVARGFGAVRVRAVIGGSEWRTSIFPSASGSYALPLKRAVRDAESLREGGPLTVRLEIIDV